QQTARISDLLVGKDVEEVSTRKLLDGGSCVRVPQHAFRGEDNQRFAPFPERLAPQQMKILGRGGRLADLDIVARGELQVTFDARTRVLRPLALVAVWQEKHESGKQVPLVLAGAHKLIDDDLATIGEVAELRFPQDQRLGIIAAVSVLESQNARFGES